MMLTSPVTSTTSVACSSSPSLPQTRPMREETMAAVRRARNLFCGVGTSSPLSGGVLPVLFVAVAWASSGFGLWTAFVLLWLTWATTSVGSYMPGSSFMSLLLSLESQVCLPLLRSHTMNPVPCSFTSPWQPVGSGNYGRKACRRHGRCLTKRVH